MTMIEAPSAGRLLIDGADVDRAPTRARRSLRQDVQMVFQNPFASLNPRKTIGNALEEPLAINTPLGAQRTRASARARCWRGSACGPSTRRATRTCSRAASASASRSRAR